MIFLVIGAALLALLVWMGRRPVRARLDLKMASALCAALAAVGAVAAGLRGAWVISLALVALSAWLGQTARLRRSPADFESSLSEMKLDQARAILGVPPGATRAEIEAAYRRLIRRAHPDQGGASDLAAQLNAARDLLVDRFSTRSP